MKALTKETIIAIRKKASKFLSKIVNSFAFINLTVVAIIFLFFYCLSPMRLANLLFAVFSVFMFDIRLYCVVVIFVSLALFFYVNKQERKIPVGAFTVDCELGTVYLHHEGKYIHVDDIIKISGTPHYYGGRIGAEASWGYVTIVTKTDKYEYRRVYNFKEIVSAVIQSKCYHDIKNGRADATIYGRRYDNMLFARYDAEKEKEEMKRGK